MAESLVDAVSRIYGMKPNSNRLKVLPNYTKSEGLIAPQFVYDMLLYSAIPGHAYQGNDVTPEQALNFASTFMGSGIAKSAMSPIEGSLAGMHVWHGSHARYSKFDFSKAGTGSGVQAYGHGGYMAEQDTTAKGYMSKDGRLYKVDLPDEHIANMLDHNLPMNQHPQHIKDKIYPLMPEEWVKPNGMFDPTIKGKDVYRELSSYHYGEAVDAKHASGDLSKPNHVIEKESQAKASEQLDKLGIPGIKYSTYGYAKPGEGPFNFVVFDDKKLKILDRWELDPHPKLLEREYIKDPIVELKDQSLGELWKSMELSSDIAEKSTILDEIVARGKPGYYDEQLAAMKEAEGRSLDYQSPMGPKTKLPK